MGNPSELIGTNVRIVSMSTELESIGKIASLVGERMSVLMSEDLSRLKDEEVWVEAFSPGLELYGPVGLLFSEGRLEFYRMGSSAVLANTDLSMVVSADFLTGQVGHQIFNITALGPNGIGYSSGSPLKGATELTVMVRSKAGLMDIQLTVEREAKVGSIFRGCASVQNMNATEYGLWRYICLEAGRVPKQLFDAMVGRQKKAA